MKRVVLAAAIAAATVWLVACGPDPADRAHLSVIQKEILTPSCALSSCHGGSSPAQGLDLREGKSYASLVNVASKLQEGTMRVVPGNAQESLLYQVITGTATDVQQMPIGSKLDPEDIQAIQLWIEEGAKDD